MFKRKTRTDTNIEKILPSNKRGRRKKKADTERKEEEEKFYNEKFENQQKIAKHLKFKISKEKKKNLDVNELLGLIRKKKKVSEMDSFICDNFIFLMCLENPVSLKICFDILSQFIHDTFQLEFSKNNIFMNYYNEQNHEFFNLYLETSSFLEYHFSSDLVKNLDLVDQVTKKRNVIFPISLNLIMLKNKLEGLNSSSQLSFYVPKNGIDSLYIHRIDSKKKDIIKTSNVPFASRTFSIVELNTDPPNYNCILSINTNEFHGQLKLLKSTNVELSIFPSRELTIFSVMNITESPDKITFKEEKNLLKFEKISNDIVAGIFSLKKLIKFTKFPIGDLFIYFSNTDPLLLEFRINNLGYLRMFIDPILNL